MNLSELRTLVRGRIRHTVKPYFVSDTEIDDNLNESEREACERVQRGRGIAYASGQDQRGGVERA